MSIRETFKNVFDNDYCGADEFLLKVMVPIFGEKDVHIFKYAEENPTGADEEILRKANIQEIYRVATVERIGTDPIEVFDVTLGDSTDLSRARVGIQRIIRSALFPYSHAFIVFHHKVLNCTEWRFSYVYKQDKNANTTDAKRFTYLFSRDLHARTAIDRFCVLTDSDKSNEALLDAFNVEALSDDFFEEYRSQYAKFVKYITGKEYVKSGTRYVEHDDGSVNEELYAEFSYDDKAVRDYVKKMMGRITFLHFLQRKGWMNHDVNYMLHLYQKSPYKDDYLDKVLEPLFFGILNTKEEGRYNLFKKSGWDMSLLDEWKSIPYLNGGLFEQEPVDQYKSVFPAAYFEKLFKFFSEYNFTVDENDPDDAEVGVDPEMLGKIFENLLEDNKDKGAYYTPKEIVRYMCQESLISYLFRVTCIEESRLRSFVTQPYDNAESFDANDIDKLYNALTSVKICDPAIGSGAFPMGLLNALVRCEEALILGKEENNDRAHLKSEIIKNNIYGVDIEKGAVDIARLRFWLSLVVDEDEASPLPNLDYKIMQGNSLLEHYKGVDLSHILDDQIGVIQFGASIKTDLKNKLEQYYSCEIHETKILLQKEINELVHQQISESGGIDSSFDDIDISGNQDFFLWHTWFSDVFNIDPDCERAPGFDIVIGNPPYIKEYTNRDAFNGFREVSPYYMGKMDIWYGFACHGIDLLNSCGTLCFIAQNNWTTSAGAKKLRLKVSNDTAIRQMLDFNTYMVFEDVGIQTMIMMFSREEEATQYSIDRRVLLPGATKSDMIALLNKVDTPFTEYLMAPHSCGQPSDNPLTFSGDVALISKILRNKSFLSDEEVAQGIVFPQDFLDRRGQAKLGTHSVGDGIFGLSMDEYHSMSLNDKERSLIKPYYTSSEIKRYYTLPENHLWMIYTDSSYNNPESMNDCPTIKSHLDDYQTIITSSNKPYGLHRARKEHFFVGEKIVSQRKCVGSPCFSYSEFDCYVTQTYFIIQTERWDMRFLTGVLNSKLVAYWLKKKGKMQGNNYQVDKEPLVMIPLPDPSIPQEAISNLVMDIITEKLRDENYDSSCQEERINQIVYTMYDLTPDEINIVESM